MIPTRISRLRVSALRSALVALTVFAVTGDALAAKAKPAVAKKHQKHQKHHKPNPLKIPNSQIEPLAWHQIDGWMADHHAEAFSTFLNSCKPILRSSEKARAQRPATYHALYQVCGRAVAAMPLNDAGARAFFEANFRAVRLNALGETAGFFTGYYEPIVEGARLPSDIYTVPLYRRPSDMVTQRLRMAGKKGMAGKRVVKRTAAYYDRAQIEDGALAGRGLEIVYLKDPIDAFFAEIQGSVRVRLEDGSVIRLNYASGNGHPYTAVGRFLIERGIVSKEEMSMQKIREFMEANPEEGKALRRLNRSYVFFRETDLSEYEEAIGAQGLPLTAARSIAVDRRLHTYGMPVFVDVTLPIQSEKPDTRFSRLMIAQDTGGAIVGPARADIYLGAGEEAARAAGRFKHFGHFVMLVPNELDPSNVARAVPLPLAKPTATAGTKVAKQEEDQAVGSAAKAHPAAAKPASPKTAASARTVAVPLPKTRPDNGPAKRSQGKPGS
jgi:membrane-bound lytic murein transglycosylase A